MLGGGGKRQMCVSVQQPRTQKDPEDPVQIRPAGRGTGIEPHEREAGLRSLRSGLSRCDFRIYLSSKERRHRVSEPRPCVLLPASQPTPTHLVPSPWRLSSERCVLSRPKGWLSRPF